MAQQHAIIVLVDVANAIQSRTLDGNVHLFDNMKFLGSTGQGTGDLVTVVPGAYWSDGSQATEQVLNWLPYNLGSIPPTVPRSYHADRARETDRQALDELSSVAEGFADPGVDTAADLNRLQRRVGAQAQRKRGGRNVGTGKILDITGNVVSDGSQAYSYPNPVITDITGPAVEEKVMYPAQYGSPDMASDGWYWAASVDSGRAGTYAYTMHIQLHELVTRNGELVWESVDLTCESALKVTTDPKVNAFTGAGLGMLPIPGAAW